MVSKSSRYNYSPEVFRVMVKMKRKSSEKKAIVLVEGPTDLDFWEPYTEKYNCYLHPACGKLEVRTILNSDALRELVGIAGIVDADSWLIRQAGELSTQNLLYDSCYSDLEMILLNSSDSSALKEVFQNTLTDYGPEQVHDWTHTLLKAAQRLAAEFGYFRLLNDCRDYYRINFKNFEYDYQPGFINFREADFIDVDVLELRREWTARRLAGSSKEQLSWEDLLRETAELREKHPPNDKRLCRGKDVIAIIAFILPSLYESHFGTELPSSARGTFQEKQLAKELRKAYKCEYFKCTSLHNCIRNWESANTPYRILKAQI